MAAHTAVSTASARINTRAGTNGAAPPLDVVQPMSLFLQRALPIRPRKTLWGLAKEEREVSPWSVTGLRKRLEDIKQRPKKPQQQRNGCPRICVQETAQKTTSGSGVTETTQLFAVPGSRATRMTTWMKVVVWLGPSLQAQPSPVTAVSLVEAASSPSSPGNPAVLSAVRRSLLLFGAMKLQAMVIPPSYRKQKYGVSQDAILQSEYT
ncbi:hypothetical protein BC827DRAFT_1156492 [Russula dissimulans]|nr:hypothetical protein BC827DRAFT_1156492 [Russula dissimulans]